MGMRRNGALALSPQYQFYFILFYFYNGKLYWKRRMSNRSRIQQEAII